MRWPSRDKIRHHKFIIIGSPILVVFVIAVVVLLFVAGGTRQAESSSRFKSAYTGISFSYPSSWSKESQDFLKHLSKTSDVDPSQGNEVILVKRGDVFFKHLLTVTSASANVGTASWNQVVEQLRSGFESTDTGSLGSTFGELKLPAASGARGVVETYYVDEKPELYQIESYILKGNIAYTFAFITPLRGSNTDETDARTLFYNIMNSLQLQ